MVQIMAWRRPGTKPLSELMMVSLPTHICVARPQWVNTFRLRQMDAYYFADNIFKCIFLNENVWFTIEISVKFVPKGPIKNIPALVQIMAWRRPGHKPLSDPMLISLPMHIWVTRPQWVTGADETYAVVTGIHDWLSLLKYKTQQHHWENTPHCLLATSCQTYWYKSSQRLPNTPICQHQWMPC